MKYIDIRITGEEQELNSFVSLLRIIQRLGTTGASRIIKLHVDGDGSGRLLFSALRDGKKVDIPSTERYEEQELIEIWIGE